MYKDTHFQQPLFLQILQYRNTCSLENTNIILFLPGRLTLCVTKTMECPVLWHDAVLLKYYITLPCNIFLSFVGLNRFRHVLFLFIIKLWFSKWSLDALKSEMHPKGTNHSQGATEAKINLGSAPWFGGAPNFNEFFFSLPILRSISVVIRWAVTSDL